MNIRDIRNERACEAVFINTSLNMSFLNIFLNILGLNFSGCNVAFSDIRFSKSL